jgi:hypothetical protein
MREQEMRLRVFRFLKARMRNMIMPAAVGIGLGGAGCFSQSGAVYSAPVPADAAMVKRDANRDVKFDDVITAGPEVSPAGAREVPMGFDASLDGEGAVDSSLADVAADVFAPMDGQPDLRYPETGMKYMGPMPLDAATGEAGGEAGIIVAKYVAPMPDAARDGMLVVRYMAQMPDTGA